MKNDLGALADDHGRGRVLHADVLQERAGEVVVKRQRDRDDEADAEEDARSSGRAAARRRGRRGRGPPFFPEGGVWGRKKLNTPSTADSAAARSSGRLVASEPAGRSLPTDKPAAIQPDACPARAGSGSRAWRRECWRTRSSWRRPGSGCRPARKPAPPTRPRCSRAAGSATRAGRPRRGGRWPSPYSLDDVPVHHLARRPSSRRSPRRHGAVQAADLGVGEPERLARGRCSRR